MIKGEGYRQLPGYPPLFKEDYVGEENNPLFPDEKSELLWHSRTSQSVERFSKRISDGPRYRKTF